MKKRRDAASALQGRFWRGFHRSVSSALKHSLHPSPERPYAVVLEDEKKLGLEEDADDDAAALRFGDFPFGLRLGHDRLSAFAVSMRIRGVT